MSTADVRRAVTGAVACTPGRVTVWTDPDRTVWQIEVGFGDMFDRSTDYVYVAGGYGPTPEAARASWFERWGSGYGVDACGLRRKIPTYWG